MTPPALLWVKFAAQLHWPQAAKLLHTPVIPLTPTEKYCSDSWSHWPCQCQRADRCLGFWHKYTYLRLSRVSVSLVARPSWPLSDCVRHLNFGTFNSWQILHVEKLVHCRFQFRLWHFNSDLLHSITWFFYLFIFYLFIFFALQLRANFAS